jgi:molecular chaperone GrpE
MATRKPDERPHRDERARSSSAPGFDPELEEDLAAQLAPERELETELESARADAARNLAAAQHWQAEFENYRKRQERDAVAQRARAGERIVTELLPVIDDLDRAIEHTIANATVGGELEHLLKGVEMVRARIISVFEKEGVEVVDPFGATFDPNLHHAVGQREDPELPEHTVIEVYQKGFVLGGRVLRPAMVIVSTGGPETAPAGSGGPSGDAE